MVQFSVAQSFLVQFSQLTCRKIGTFDLNPLFFLLCQFRSRFILAIEIFQGEIPDSSIKDF